MELRKVCTFIEEVHIEGGKAGARPVTSIVVAAVLRNPWAGRGFVENLRPEIVAIAPRLGHELTHRLLALMPAERIESYGKAAAVGVAGEIEHASALIHNDRGEYLLHLRVGSPVRRSKRCTTPYVSPP